jgi:hypothetical protein
MSYGRLANTHLIQKYGFIVPNNSYNQVAINAAYHDYQAIVNEEKDMKAKMR